MATVTLFLKPGGDSFALLEQFFGHNAAQRIEELFVLGQLLRPFFMIDSENFRDAFVIDVEFGEIEIMRARQPTDRRFERTASSFAAVNNPFEHAHVFAVTRPEKLALPSSANPLYAAH